MAEAAQLETKSGAQISELERMAAELEIRNLIAKIFLLTDTSADMSEYEQCFAPDAIWERRDAPEVLGAHLTSRAVGRDVIMADRRNVRERKDNGPDAAAWHMATNILVSVKSKDTARAWTAWFFMADRGEGYKVSSAGFYQDDIKRIDGRWRLAHRQFTLSKPPQDMIPRP